MENETAEEEPVLVIPYLVPPSFLRVVDGVYISAFPNVTHLDLYDTLRIKTVVYVYPPTNQSPKLTLYTVA
jgi:hypothetical protein